MLRESVDKAKLQVAFNSFTGRDCDGIDSLLNQWGKAKANIADLFGGKLKVETKVKLFKSSDDIKMASKDFIAKNRELLTDDMIWVLKSSNVEDYINNISNMENWYIPNSLRTGYNRGVKLSRYLSSLVKDEADYICINEKMKTKREWFDIQYSKFQQSLKYEGVLALSIDPIDYLTMSVNNSGWRSCHHAQNGEYRGGCLSYMVDTTSVVAYCYNGKEVHYDNYNFSHNSKNWRQMVFIDVSSKGAVFSRCYPREDSLVTGEIYKILGGLFSEKFGIENTWCLNSDEEDVKESVWDCDNHLHYADISNGYEGTIFTMTNKRSIAVDVGDEPRCPCCGINWVDKPENLTCYSCNGRHCCYNCEDMVDEDEMMRGVNGEMYCSYCWNDRFIHCAVCGSVKYEHDAYCTDDGSVCPSCYENYISCINCGNSYPNEDMNEVGDEGDFACISCVERHYIECSSCNCLVRTRNAEDGMCPECYEQEQERIRQEEEVAATEEELEEVS